MRVEYTVGGRVFKMRTFQQRDITELTGRLAILPMAGQRRAAMPAAEVAWKSNSLASALLCACALDPRIIPEDPIDIPDGVIPVNELSDADWVELIGKLSTDSGFTAEAAEQIRPSSETSAAS